MSATIAPLANWLDVRRTEVEAALRRYLPDRQATPPRWPAMLLDAMQYSLLAGGKRLRPMLTLAAAEAVAAPRAEDRNGSGDAGTEARRLALPAACAIEMIHTYSLIHDDLPAMDDDSLRRGRPTSHIQFGEGMAILAGDGLLTEAFALLAREPAGATFEISLRQLRTIAIVADAAGAAGMVGGQAIDLHAARPHPGLDAQGHTTSPAAASASVSAPAPDAKRQTPDAAGRTPDAGRETPDATGETPDAGRQTPRATGRAPGSAGTSRSLTSAPSSPLSHMLLVGEEEAGRGGEGEGSTARRAFDAAALRDMHARKTGALIRAAAVAGAIMAGAAPDAEAAVATFATDLGLAFQIVDDVLDVEGTAAGLGKTAGKDAASGKPTYPALFGLDRSKQLAREAVDRARATLAAAGIGGRLPEIAAWVIERTN